MKRQGRTSTTAGGNSKRVVMDMTVKGKADVSVDVKNTEDRGDNEVEN